MNPLTKFLGVKGLSNGGKLPPGIKRATDRAKESKSVLPVAGARQARQAIQGYLGMDPSFSVMDPEAQALESAYRGGETASVLGDLVASLTPFAAASAAAKANQVPGLAQLIAYHGSPHRFKKFDASKIGTGEGAQAYGYGLYFAENPDVAKTYQPRSPQYEQKLLKKYNAAEARRDYTTMEILEDAMMHRSPEEILQRYTNISEGYTPAHAKAAKDFASWYAKNLPEVGGMYKVDIPDEKIAQMLDWDKPLSQQPAAMQVARKVFNDPQRKSAGFPSITDEEIGNLTGQDLYQAMTTTRGGLQPGASKSLLQEGIPGIQYLDQASRDAKQGTRNFVVFPGEEQNIKMLDIDGVPQKADGGLIRMSNGGDRFMGKTPKRGVSSLPGYGEGDLLKDIEAAYPRVAGAIDTAATLAPIFGRALVSPAVSAGTFVKEAIKSGDPRDTSPLQRASEASEEFITGDIRPFRTQLGPEYASATLEGLESALQASKLPPILPQAWTASLMPGVTAATKQAAKTAGKEMLRPIDQAMMGQGPLAGAFSAVSPMNVTAPVSKLGFYNPIEETATTLQRKQGPGQAFLNEFTKAGISKQRLEDAGLAQKLAAAPNITREEVQAMTKGTMPDVEEVVLSRSVIPPYMKGFANLHMPDLNVNDYRQINQLRKIADERYQKALAENDLDAAEFAMKAEEDINKFSRTHSYGTKPGERLTEFHEYQEPGGKNYREVLLKVPVKRVSEEEARVILNARPEDKLSAYDIDFASRKANPEFRSAHWMDPNVISHIRMNDRVDADNKNVLFIEELQSDWAQEGRKKGFGKDVPQGPFVKNTNEWVDLSLKNIIKRAVDEGYDRVAFIDGYKSYLRFPQGADGESTEAGMRKFYDEIIPGRLKALVGKDNVRTIPGITQQRPLDVSLQGDRYYVVDADTDIAIPDHPGFRSLERAEQYLDELYSKSKSMDQIGFDITPEIREKFSAPIPYKRGGAVKSSKSRPLNRMQVDTDAMRLEMMRKSWRSK